MGCLIKIYIREYDRFPGFRFINKSADRSGLTGDTKLKAEKKNDDEERQGEEASLRSWKEFIRNANGFRCAKIEILGHINYTGKEKDRVFRSAFSILPVS